MKYIMAKISNYLLVVLIVLIIFLTITYTVKDINLYLNQIKSYFSNLTISENFESTEQIQQITNNNIIMENNDIDTFNIFKEASLFQRDYDKAQADEYQMTEGTGNAIANALLNV
jgi:predicted PurR-regulated permease PerM